jgi:hypothetical protein
VAGDRPTRFHIDRCAPSIVNGAPLWDECRARDGFPVVISKDATVSTGHCPLAYPRARCRIVAQVVQALPQDP